MSKNKLKESIFILKVVTFDCINVVYAQLIYRSEMTFSMAWYYQTMRSKPSHFSVYTSSFKI